MKIRYFILLASIAVLTCPVHADAQTGLNASRDEPIEITADESLEWKRNEQIFVARKNALAVQGEVSVAAQTLTANYREAAGSDLEIWRVTADTNVIIRSSDSAAYGDRATYNIDEGLAVMKGENLRMDSPDQTVTAHDSFEYWVTDGRINAIGRAKVVRPKPEGGTDTIEADKISAILKENAQGERVLHSMEAVGNVIITSPSEIVTGAYGIYKADTNKAELTGGVTIRRGPNILQGEKAYVDLNTNTSQMFGSQMPNGRVRGVFYPGSEEKTLQK